MADVDLIIELAKQHSGLIVDKAHLAAVAISYEISDRRGFDVRALDDETLEEIIQAWTEIIRKVVEDDEPIPSLGELLNLDHEDQDDAS